MSVDVVAPVTVADDLLNDQQLVYSAPCPGYGATVPVASVRIRVAQRLRRGQRAVGSTEFLLQHGGHLGRQGGHRYELAGQRRSPASTLAKHRLTISAGSTSNR